MAPRAMQLRTVVVFDAPQPPTTNTRHGLAFMGLQAQPVLIDGRLGMLGFHGIVHQNDGLLIHFCTFGAFRHFAKVVTLF